MYVKLWQTLDEEVQFPNINVIPLVERKKDYFYKNSSGAFHDSDSSSFKTSFKQQVIGLSFEVCTFSYLNWLQNGELLNLEVKKKCLNYDDLCSKMHLFQALFLDFQI